MLASFVTCLALVFALGLASMRRGSGTVEDYYVASRDVSPALVGLSAVATNNSGYMFIGVIGFTYSAGLTAVWLMVGWIVGDFIASLLVHRKLRQAAERHAQLSFAGTLANWNGREFRALRVVAAVVTVLFLGAYAAAQFSAGGKALQAVFGWNPHAGAVLVTVVVAAYCLAGGIRASIWTDAAQALIMLVAMAVLLAAAVAGLGGFAAAHRELAAVPDFLAWFPTDLAVPGVTGMLLFITGWLFAGLSVVGQPHILIRFMALDRPEHLVRARGWYYSFFAVFYAMATGVGLVARLYLPDLAALDPELALPRLAMMLLHPLVVGVVLAGIFAATMSTADSLVLSCSAALTNDLVRPTARPLLAGKVATLVVALFALGIAITGPRSVFMLVIAAWSTLGSAFGPLLIVLASGGRPSERLALAMIATGPAIAFLWRAIGWHEQYYEGMPGMLAGLLVYWLGRRRVPFEREAEAPQSAVVPARTNEDNLSPVRAEDAAASSGPP